MKRILTLLIVFILVIFTWNIIIGYSIMFRPFFEKTENIPSFEKERIVLSATEGKSLFKTDKKRLEQR